MQCDLYEYSLLSFSFRAQYESPLDWHLLFNHSSLLLRERDARSFLVHQPKAQSKGDEPEKNPHANSGEDLFCVAFGGGGICFSFGTHYNARVVACRLPISF